MKVYPKRRFGQHFLRDTGILTRLERLIQPSPRDCVIEIGAGDGALSQRIAPFVSRFQAVEVDADQMPSLQAVLAPYPHAKAIQADILGLDLGPLLSESRLDCQRTRFVGNLPYNIATAVIHQLLRLTIPVWDMTFMVQLEVAQRIVASPGSRAYGYLSVDCQHRADARLSFKVSPACFAPRPKVMSAIIILRPRGPDAAENLDVAFDDLVKAAFAHRRKTLANSLRRHPGIGPIAECLLERAEIDGGRRAEDLSVQDYEKLALAYCRLFQSSKCL